MTTRTLATSKSNPTCKLVYNSSRPYTRVTGYQAAYAREWTNRDGTKSYSGMSRKAAARWLRTNK